MFTLSYSQLTTGLFSCTCVISVDAMVQISFVIVTFCNKSWVREEHIDETALCTRENSDLQIRKSEQGMLGRKLTASLLLDDCHRVTTQLSPEVGLNFHISGSCQGLPWRVRDILTVWVPALCLCFMSHTT